jgi:hypothetical protein
LLVAELALGSPVGVSVGSEPAVVVENTMTGGIEVSSGGGATDTTAGTVATTGVVDDLRKRGRHD